MTLALIEIRDLDSTYGFIVDLPQNETEEILLEHLARRGVEGERDTRMLRLEQDDAGVSVHVVRAAGSETIQCSYLVGCDGAYSTVGHALGLKVAISPVAQQL